MSRLEEWKKPKRLLTLLSGGREEVIELFKKHWKQTNNDESGTPRMTTSDVIGAAKELIFELRNGLPYFHSSQLQAIRLTILCTLNNRSWTGFNG